MSMVICGGVDEGEMYEAGLKKEGEKLRGRKVEREGRGLRHLPQKGENVGRREGRVIENGFTLSLNGIRVVGSYDWRCDASKVKAM